MHFPKVVWIGYPPGAIGLQTEMLGDELLSEDMDSQVVSKPAAASQIMKVAIGLLGLDLHEKPSSWAQTWLEACSVGEVSFSMEPKLAKEVDEGFWSDRDFKKGQADWQRKVLSHLRQLYPKEHRGRSKEKVERRGPHAEQLETVDFILQRITSTVNLLQRPERHAEPPLILHQYTDGMVRDVCADLKQWLEQLANILSVYHVHILDLEGDKRQLTSKVGGLEEKLKESEVEKEDAVRRFQDMDARWNEEKMKKRAAALFGVKSSEEDPKIYSQLEVDEMYEQWKKEQVDPLLEEIQSLKKAQRDLLAKMQSMKHDRSAPVAAIQEEITPSLGSREIALLNACLTSASERSLGELKALLLRLGHALSEQRGSAEFQEILRLIQAIPILDIPESMETGSQADADHPAIGQEELELLHVGLKAAGKHVSPDLASLLSQLGQGVAEGSDLKRVVQLIQKVPLPVPIVLPEKPAMRSTGTNTAQVVKEAPEPTVLVQPDERDFEGELRRLRESLEAQVRAAQAEAEKQRKRAEEAMQKLQEETQRLENLIAELRRKLKELQALLEKAGLGAQVHELFQQAGLGDFLAGRDVFERLYRDALRRMRTQAEVQARLAEESSLIFMRTLRDLSSHPLAAVDSLLTANEYASVVAPLQVLRFAKPPEGEEGGAFSLVPREKEKPRPMRFKTTSVLERPTSPKTPPSVGGAKLKRAATMVARPHTFHGHSPPPSAFSRDKPRTSSRETKSTKLISARPLATGANWPIAVEGRTFSRTGSGDEISERETGRSSPSASPVIASRSPQHRVDEAPLLVSAIGVRPSQSQLLPRVQGSQGSPHVRAHRATPSSQVLRSAGSLCTDSSR